MSARENFVSIEGNLVTAPELRYTPSGKAVATITIATSERRLVDGQWVDGHTSYFDAVAWERLAEHACATLGKGDRVHISGALKQRSWEAADGSGTRYKVEIAADAVNVSLRFATATMQKASYGGMDAETVQAATVVSSKTNGRDFVPAGAVEEDPF
jgi:single-strand DNA-binding protein